MKKLKQKLPTKTKETKMIVFNCLKTIHGIFLIFFSFFLIIKQLLNKYMYKIRKEKNYLLDDRIEGK